MHSRVWKEEIVFKLEYKLNIIEDLKNDKNISNLVAEYNIKNFILGDIKNNKLKLLEFIIRISKELK